MPAPRPEYPRPQLFRPTWLSLNGEWEFEIDRGDSGLERGLLERPLNSRILVPFAPESTASGIGDTDFLTAVWYRRVVTIPPDWAGQRVLLHVGACDHDTTIWVNGAEVTRHRGGFTSFSAPLDGAVTAGEEAVIVVRARDSRHGVQARGKQSTDYANAGVLYTRTTGIWQTVWLEAVPVVSIASLHIEPQLGTGSLHVTARLTANSPAHTIRLELLDTYRPDGDVAGVGDDGGMGGDRGSNGDSADRADGDDGSADIIATTTIPVDRDLSPRAVLTIPADRLRPWSPDDPHLYGMRVMLLGPHGETIDRVSSYAGLRSVTIDGNRLLVNGEPRFQRLVLDQGFWPETLMTAPSDGALAHDIELAMAAGFNGARLHQKVFEERYLYHADRLGFLVWGEFGDWGANTVGAVGENQRPTASFITQWLEALQRDLNHPSIVGWCPLNETHQRLHDRITVLDDVTRGMFLATKLADPTRPVLDASGYSHRVPDSDVYDSHNYEQDPRRFASQNVGLADGQPYVNRPATGEFSIGYRGQPYFVSEFGGIWWARPGADGGAAPDAGTAQDGWGYGPRVASEQDFYRRFAGLVAVLRDDPDMFGYCYTQLTDVFQECNGIYRFDRSTKLDVGRIKAIQERPAAYQGATANTTAQ